MFACPLYNDILEPVFRNEVKNPLISDTEALNFVEKPRHEYYITYV